jgi:hypothetical protein
VSHWDLFLAAGIRQPGCHERNSRIIAIAESVGMRVFAPGRDTPAERQLRPVDIVEQNRKAIHEAPTLLFVPDRSWAWCLL